MSVIATIVVPADDFILDKALAPNSGVRVRLQNVIPLGDSFLPYLRVTNETLDDIESELRNETDIDAFDIVDSVNGEALVRIEWAQQVDGLLTALDETNASILDGVGQADQWRFQLRFDTHEQLTDFYHHCVANDIHPDIESIHNSGTLPPLDTEFELTDPQHEVLALALERGYFDVPRQINVVELADELGISDSAVSQRLRRGTQTILSNLLAHPDDDDTESSG